MIIFALSSQTWQRRILAVFFFCRVNRSKLIEVIDFFQFFFNENLTQIDLRKSFLLFQWIESLFLFMKISKLIWSIKEKFFVERSTYLFQWILYEKKSKSSWKIFCAPIKYEVLIFFLSFFSVEFSFDVKDTLLCSVVSSSKAD